MAKVLKWLGIIMFVLSFIAGILYGSIYMIEPQEVWEDKTFNWPLMISFWAGGAVWGILVLGFSKVVEYLESIAYSIRNIENHTIPQQSKTSTNKLSGFKI